MDTSNSVIQAGNTTPILCIGNVEDVKDNNSVTTAITIVTKANINSLSVFSTIRFIHLTTRARMTVKSFWTTRRANKAKSGEIGR
jgi:hypothetical protein